MMLHPENMVGCFRDVLEVQEGAFMMFWPSGEWGFGSRGGVSGVCHCEFEY